MIEPFQQRRAALLSQIGNSIAVVPTAPEAIRNNDAHYPFRGDSHFLYLSGFAEPEAVIVLDGVRGKSLLFCREKNIEMEIWEGFRYGPHAAREFFGFDEAYPISDLPHRLPQLLLGAQSLQWPLGLYPAWDASLRDALLEARKLARLDNNVPDSCADIRTLLDEMRLIKDERELDVLQHAGRISAEAHLRAMQACRPGMMEYEIEAELLHHFVRNGARQPAYESIVAGGENACVLHYAANNARLNDGELLLIDAGCELNGYAGDITRTFPINGRFSAVQRDVYDVVLAAHQAAIASIRPGVALNVPADTAVRILAQGMLDLGLLQGSLDGVIESGDYRRFYMHGIGHFIGLDVHDVGVRKQDGQWREYRAGMVTTIEPGIYIRPDDRVPAAFHNIGIRIEDNVLVTADGHHVYTGDAPVQADDIEAVMQAAREQG